MQGKRIPRDGMPVLHGDLPVGHVTSGTKGPSVGKGIAMALVSRDLTEPGTELIVDVRGRLEPAVVIPGPSFLQTP